MYMCEECNYIWDEKRHIGNPEIRQCPKCLSYEIEETSPADLPEAGASAERINSGVRLLPCPFCGRQPKEYWDYKSPESEIYNEGYNITCCVVHITAIFKDEAIEHWNTRQ